MTKTAHVYLHDFSSLDDAPFSVREYSQLKFGDETAARKFGDQLGAGILQDAGTLGLVLGDRPCVIVPAPCSTVPVAGALLAVHARNYINDQLVRLGRPPVEWSRIHRDVHYNFNYSELPLEERQALLTDEGRYLNRDYLDGKNLIFVDDVRITGTHEVKIEHLLEARGLSHLSRGYAAIARYTGTDATIEHRLNHAWVGTAEDLVTLAHRPGHTVTTRSIRLLLETEPAMLRALLLASPRRFVEESYHAAIVKAYHVYEPYAEAFQVLRDRFDELNSSTRLSSELILPFPSLDA